MKRFLSLFVLLCSANGLSHSSALESGKPKTELHFEHHVVEGKSLPDLMNAVEGVGKVETQSILDLREDFLDKIASETGGFYP